MSSDDIPQEVRTFIADHINSVVELEVLLLLRASSQRQWTAEEISRELRIDATWAATQLANLCAQQILACNKGPPETYGYAPPSPDADRLIAGLASAYASYSVTVISLIFSKPVDKLRSFADAFILRKEKPDGR